MIYDIIAAISVYKNVRNVNNMSGHFLMLGGCLKKALKMNSKYIFCTDDFKD